MSARAFPPAVIDVQHAASDPAASAWVAANAGSGKTHVLAQRVIRLLLADADPANILCLTFTKAAAANMANRVFDDARATGRARRRRARQPRSRKIEGRRPDAAAARCGRGGCSRRRWRRRAG